MSSNFPKEKDALTHNEFVITRNAQVKPGDYLQGEIGLLISKVGSDLKFYELGSSTFSIVPLRANFPLTYT